MQSWVPVEYQGRARTQKREGDTIIPYTPPCNINNSAVISPSKSLISSRELFFTNSMVLKFSLYNPALALSQITAN